jgi:serine/threonine protein kinase
VIGTTIGAYRVRAKLGEGGMGEVYRARDSRRDRDVAVKVLPPRLVGDAPWVARFEREARALAALSHPNIAVILGVEEIAASWTGEPAARVLIPPRCGVW